MWVLKHALLWASRTSRVSGRQVEVLVWHFIQHGLYARSALSVFRATYDFIRDCYWTPARPWARVRYELRLAVSIRPLLGADMSRPWSPHRCLVQRVGHL